MFQFAACISIDNYYVNVMHAQHWSSVHERQCCTCRTGSAFCNMFLQLDTVRHLSGCGCIYMAPVMAIQFDKRPKAEIWCCMRHFRVSCLNFCMLKDTVSYLVQRSLSPVLFGMQHFCSTRVCHTVVHMLCRVGSPLC